jgi:hypothetical protein
MTGSLSDNAPAERTEAQSSDSTGAAPSHEGREERSPQDRSALDRQLRLRSYEVSFRVETALFLHGGESSSAAELRTSALKGMMRYWFRAAACQFAPLKQVRQLEWDLFGGPGRRAPFQIAVAEFNRQQAVVDRGLSILPHKEQPNARQQRSAIRAGTTFAVRISPRLEAIGGASHVAEGPVSEGPVSEGPIDARLSDRSRQRLSLERYEILFWCLWCSAHLGGIGTRSRRGAGSLSIRKMSPPFDPLLFPRDVETPQALTETLSAGLSRFMQLLRSQLTGGAALAAPSGASPTDTLHGTPHFSASSKIRVAPVGASTLDEQEVRSKVMMLLRPHKNPAFGLPLRLDSGWVRGAPDVRRHASPLHLHLSRGKSQWLLTAIELAPLPSVVAAEATVATPCSNAPIESFLASLPELVEIGVLQGAVSQDSGAENQTRSTQ